MNQADHIIIQKLDEFIRKYYKNQLIKGLLYSVGLVLLFYIGLSTLEYFAEFGTIIRTILFYSFVFVSGYVITKYIVVPVLKLNSFGKVISHNQAAAIIGSHFTNVQDKLLNVLQLQSTQNNYASLDLLNASINQKITELKPVPFTAAIDINENKKYLKYVAVPFLLLFSILIIAPKILKTGTKRLIHHSSYFEKEAPFQFEIENKDLKAIQQQDFVIHVKIIGNQVPAEAFVVIKGNEFKVEKQKADEFTYTFKNVQQDVDFQLSGGGFTSKPYKLTALPKPVLLGFEAQLKYPIYLNRKDEVINNTGDMLVPQGTKITWTFNTKNSDGISLHFSDSLLELKPSAENKFSFTKRFMQNSAYNINTNNRFVQKADSVNYSINVIPDAYPVIEMHEKADSLKTDIIYFSGNIKDDYGFNHFQFKYKVYSSDSSGTTSEKAQEYSMPLQGSQVTQPFVHYIDISKMDLKPGDKVEYYFEVWDNDGVNGSKSAKTNIAVFKAPTLDELEKATDKNNADLKNDLEQSLKKTKELQKDIADLNKKVLEKKQLGYDEKKQLEKLLKNQKELEKKVDQIKQNNLQNNEEQNKYKPQNESILEKQKELEKLFENMMTPEMKKMFDELQKLMDKMDKNKVQETLEKLKMSDKDIEKELDRTLEQFKQMEVEQKLEDVTKKLDELAKKQEELSKEVDNKKANEDKNKTDNKDNKTAEQKKQDEKNQTSENKKDDANKTAEQKQNEQKQGEQKKQDELTKSFDEIKKDIQQMQELNKSLENKVPVPDTKAQEQKASQEQQNASEQLQKNNNKNASKSQKEAAEQMQQMSSQMQQALNKMQQEHEGEDIDAVRQLMENLLHVSFAQEDLDKDIKKTKTNDPHYTKLAQNQKQIQDDSKMIEDSLFALSKRNPKISATINREINATQMNMEKGITALEERNSGEAQVRGQNAMTSINNLALMLNEALENMEAQMKAQSKPKPGGGGACKKPGSGQKPSPSMSNMRKMQEQLNKQIEQMKKMLEQQGKEPGGKKPGDKPGQQKGGMNPYGNTPGESESLAKMAAEQEAIRRSVQEAMQKMKKEGGQQPGGDMMSKMEETETDLVNKRITQETIKRQQEIMTKLLESEKAERQQEEDEKRKSNEAKTQDYTNPAVFLEYQKMKEKETELLKTIPADLTPYYRQKVNQYFNAVEK
ncbi:MAG TPA: DUF4175 family protein [Bacteroidia bacterium]|nr:DUF4175 family protein [Bacteroidia bacterium]